MKDKMFKFFSLENIKETFIIYDESTFFIDLGKNYKYPTTIAAFTYIAIIYLCLFRIHGKNLYLI